MCVYIHITCFLSDGYLVCFYILTIVNNPAMRPSNPTSGYAKKSKNLIQKDIKVAILERQSIFAKGLNNF